MKKFVFGIVLLCVCWCGVVHAKSYTVDELIENIQKVPSWGADIGEASFGLHFKENMIITTEENTIYMEGKDSYSNIRGSISLVNNRVVYHVDERVLDDEFIKGESSANLSSILMNDKYLISQLFSGISYMTNVDGFTYAKVMELLYDTSSTELLKYGVTKKEVTYEIEESTWAFLAEFSIDLNKFEQLKNEVDLPNVEVENPETGESIPFDFLIFGIFGLFLLIILRNINKLKQI